MPSSKAITLRLSDEDYLCVETVADIDEVTVSDLIRRAIDQYIKKRDSEAAMESLLRLNERKVEVLAAKLANSN